MDAGVNRTSHDTACSSDLAVKRISVHKFS